MTYNRFYFFTVIKLLLMLISCFLVAYVTLYYGKRFFTLLVLFILILIQLIHLIYYVNKTNRELATFLLYLKEGNTSFVFDENKFERNFGNLYKSYRNVKEGFSRLSKEKEKNIILLQQVVEHLATPFLGIKNDSEIIISNRSASDLFGNKKFKKLSDLAEIHFTFPEIIKGMSNKQQRTFEIKTLENKSQTLLLSASEFRLEGDLIKLISIQDIENEMEEKEIQSYHKLVRVLAHEISNSINPITMLVGNIKIKSGVLLKNKKFPASENEKILHDINRSAEIIETRGNGLIDFINGYKNFTSMPKIEVQEVDIEVFLQDSLKILDAELKEKNITTSISVEENLGEFIFDPHQIEQVIINLIKNAIQACVPTKGESVINLKAYSEKLYNYIEVVDNGVGIEKEILDKIFIPFFTTKKEGSGIGLSFSKNIMHLHQGQIFAYSQLNETKFIMKFKRN